MKENKYWNLPRYGEKQENEVSCWTVAIPNLPMFPNKKVRKFIEWVHELDGFVGLRPEYPRGTLLLFKTENEAKRARNQIRIYPGYNSGVGDNICEVYIPKEYVK